MPFLESSDNPFCPFLDIYRTVEQYFPSRVRQRQYMDLACRTVCLEVALDDRFYISFYPLSLGMRTGRVKSASDPRSTLGTLMDDIEAEFPARACTVQIKSRSFLEDNSLFSVVVCLIENHPGFTGWNMDCLRECVKISDFHLTFHRV